MDTALTKFTYLEANLAAHHLKRKTRTYRSLHTLNDAFDVVSRQCWMLEYLGFMPIFQMRTFNGLVRELQAQINHAVTSRMFGVEGKDRFHFGKTRIAWEHHLNPKRPPFKPHQ